MNYTTAERQLKLLVKGEGMHYNLTFSKGQKDTKNLYFSSIYLAGNFYTLYDIYVIVFNKINL